MKVVKEAHLVYYSLLHYILDYICCDMEGGKSRYKNGIQAYTSFTAASLLHKPIVYGMPPALSFELTDFCNLRCPECPSGSGKMKRGRGFMNSDLFKSVISETKPFLFNANLYFQGEPMMHPEFFNFLDRSKDVHTTVSTNGHFISEENAEMLVLSGLNKLIISVDGIDQETYSKYRINGNLEKVLTGLRAVAEAKKRMRTGMKIIVQFLVNRHNQHQVVQIRKLTRELNVELALKSMQLYNMNLMDLWLPEENSFRRYSKEGNGYKIKSRLPRYCSRLWLNPVITWDGKVLPCCFDKDGEYVMGDLNRFSFREIWQGKEYAKFRKMILSGREKIEICRNCTSGLNGVKK